MLISAALFTAVAGIVIVAAAFSRPPWLDELTTLYYTDAGLSDLLARYRRDGNPIGYYLPVHFVGRFSNSLGLMRLGAFALIVGSMSAVGAVVARDRSRWAHALLVTAPALVGTAIFVDFGGDLRTYGSMSAAALVLAAALYAAELRVSSVSFAAANAGLVGIAILHVWGTILAGVIGIIVVVANWSRLRARDVAAPLVGLAVVYAAYRYGPLEAESLRNMLQFDLVDAARTMRDGISPNPAIFVALAVMWVASLRLEPKSMLVWDLPATVTFAVAVLISLNTPIFKRYVIIAVAVLLVAGMLVRLSRRPWMYLIALALLALNFATASSDVFEEDDDFGASTAYVKKLDLSSSRCPLYVSPSYRDLFHSHYFLGDLPLAPIEQVGTCECTDAWVLANHAGPRKQRRLLAGGEYEVVARWDKAVLARTECSA